MRVIAGEAKGRTLVVPRGGGTRAATDRIREPLFAILGPGLGGAGVRDLFAGAGSWGIEALSRGAAAVTFVGRGPEALKALRRNLEATRLSERASVVAANVLGYLDRAPAGPFDLALCDPPFADVAVLEANLAHARPRAALAPGGPGVDRVIRRHGPALPADLAVVRVKDVGEESLLFLGYSQPAP